MARLRATKEQRNKIRLAKKQSRQIAEQLVQEGKLHRLAVRSFQCKEEQELRANPLGSKFFRRIYPTKPMTRYEIQNEFSTTKSTL